MSLTLEQRAELERRGPSYVRRQLSYAASTSDDDAPVRGFQGFGMRRGDVAAWLEEKDRQARAEADRIAAETLRWAKAAAWIGVAGGPDRDRPRLRGEVSKAAVRVARIRQISVERIRRLASVSGELSKET